VERQNERTTSDETATTADGNGLDNIPSTDGLEVAGHAGKTLEKVNDPDFIEVLKVDRSKLPKGGPARTTSTLRIDSSAASIGEVVLLFFFPSFGISFTYFFSYQLPLP
jgi:hypothetical protein